MSSTHVGWSQTPPDSVLRTIEKSQIEILIHLTPTEIQNLKTTTGAFIQQEEINKKNPEDLGDLTSRFLGVFVRSYGGAGGLKTMNARGLGSQHFLIVANQQALIFNQMGSANLGDIQVDGLNAVTYSLGGTDAWDLPTLTKTYSGVLHLEFLELNQNLKDFIQLQTVGGSFGRYKLSGHWLKKTKKATLFAQAYGYQMNGDFPFDYRHGSVLLSGVRANNFTREAQGRIGANFALNANSKLQFSVQYLTAFRQLPGAIVFYHPENYQTLGNEQINGNVKYSLNKQKFKLIQFANFSSTNTNYRDSFHLVKPQWQNYNENNFDLGHNGQFEMGFIKLNWSGQYIFSSLLTNRADILLPIRHRFLLSVGGEFQHKLMKVRFDFPLQNLIDKTATLPNQNRLLLTPSMGLNQVFLGARSKSIFRISMGQFSRVASFSEMYYGQIGNPDLRPEISQMINSGLHHQRRLGKIALNVGADFFYGLIQDKIIAIPTQNLFVWSVRNVQTVRNYGFDAIASLNYHFKKMSSFLSFSQKSSFNVAWDISDPNGPTYKHQIPYTPYWLHASEFTLKRKNISVTYSYNFSDFRFVLGENIAANVLDAFHIHDFRLNYECFREKRPQQVWRIHLKCNNLFNQSYQVIRSFPLPGRNFEIGISLKYQS